MKPVQATIIGVILASTLVLATHADTPEDVAARIVQAEDEQSLLATWNDWHPDAEHKIIIKYGLGQKDEIFSYRVADDLAFDESEFAEVLQGYAETSRTEPEITSQIESGVSRVTTVINVGYTWEGYQGTMRQTDEFVFAPYLGGTVIRSLTTTYDYR